MNNKLALARRIAGYKAAEAIIDSPDRRTAGRPRARRSTRAKANEIDAAGVTRVTVLVEKKGQEAYPVIVISNGMRGRPALLSASMSMLSAGINEQRPASPCSARSLRPPADRRGA